MIVNEHVKTIAEDILENHVNVWLIRAIMKKENVRAEDAVEILQDKIAEAVNARIGRDDWLSFANDDGKTKDADYAKMKPPEIWDCVFNKASIGYKVGYADGFADLLAIVTGVC